LPLLASILLSFNPAEYGGLHLGVSMIRLINPNDHDVHILDPRTRQSVCVSPDKQIKHPSKTYVIDIEESDLKKFQPFMELKMLRVEVSPVKSTTPVAVAETSIPSRIAAAQVDVPSRKVDGPSPDLEKRIEGKPALPRRKA
jgi:hypothetical protein